MTTDPTHADCPTCRPRTAGPIPGTPDLADAPCACGHPRRDHRDSTGERECLRGGPAANGYACGCPGFREPPVALPDLADVTALPTAMCTAEDETRELGCSLPAGHPGAHLDYTRALAGDSTDPDAFLTPDQYDDHREGPDQPEADTREAPSSTWDGATPAAPFLEELPPTLTAGLTVWGGYGGAQIRLESALLTDDTGEPILDPTTGAPQLAAGVPPIGCLYIAFRDDAIRSPENGRPYRLNLTEARALRDLLNTATARGAL